MVTRVQLGTGGDENTATVTEMPSSKNYTTSDDIDMGGVTFRNAKGMVSQTHDVGSLADEDIVEIGGMQVQVGMAKQMGLMGDIEAAAKAAAPNAAPQGTPEDATKTDNEAYDRVVSALNTAIENGEIEHAEAVTYETAVGSLAMAGLDTQTALQTLDDLNAGKVSESDIPAEKLMAIDNARNEVTQAATKSAIGELGDSGFAELSQLAASNPAVNQIILTYAIDRAQGLNQGVTWAELFAGIKEDLGFR